MSQIINNTYRIIDVIGKGGMSTVFKAEHIRLGTIWAVKEVSKKQKAKFDFLAEANILKKLDHPMLPKIVDIFENDDFLYVVEDYVEGENLEKILKRQIKFDEKVGLVWFKQIAECLGYLHSQKPNPIIYRDMKPSNIMVQPDGSLKIIDFGIAREYKEESLADTTFIGTKGYAAPEQAGKSQSDARTDIYSLGVTMYHILSGKSPYEPPYSFVPIRNLNPDLSVGIEVIIDKCVQQEPENRYSSTKELIDDLEHIYKFDNEYKKLVYKQKFRKIRVILMLVLSIALIVSGFWLNQKEQERIIYDYLNKSKELIEEDPALALEYVDDVLDISSDNIDAHILKSKAYYNLYDYQGSVDYIMNVAFSFEDLKENGQLFIILAEAYIGLGNYEQSVYYFEKVVSEMEEKNVQVMQEYITALALDGKADEAVKVIEEVQDWEEFKNSDTAKADFAYNSGMIYYFLEDYNAAKEQFDIALNSNTPSETVTVTSHMMVQMYFDMANSDEDFGWDSVIELINKIMQLKGMKSDATLWEKLGEAYYNKAIYQSDKNYDDLIKAADAFQQLLDMNIQKKYIYVNQFVLYEEAREYGKASLVLDEMEKTYPDAYEANAYRSILLIMMENNKDISNRNYDEAYNQYLIANSKLKENDNKSLMNQLNGLIEQLRQGNWLN